MIEKCKYEDWRVAQQYIQKDGYMCSYDLKSGYLHVDIYPEHAKFLGFIREGNGKIRYYMFLVLPFGVVSGPKVFTKLIRALVKHWRFQGNTLVSYLDDGWLFHKTYLGCLNLGQKIKSDLKRAGFLVNHEKSVWVPTQCLEWLGLLWNTKNGTMQIPERRLISARHSQCGIMNSNKTTARLLAQLTGKVISMSPVLGNVTPIMTRHLYKVIDIRSSWDTFISVKRLADVQRELQFWDLNLDQLNIRDIFETFQPEVVVYSDASSVAGAAYAVTCRSHVAHKTWRDNEKGSSSTWRELVALQYGLLSFVPLLKGRTVK